MGAADELDGYEPDKLGEWSERKIAIVSKYAAAYANILVGQRLKHFYIDGFAGGPIALRKETGEQIATTARRIFEIEPAFAGYHLVDADADKVAAMASACAGRPQAIVVHGDANKVLPVIFETIRYSDFKRALCFLDPYKILLDWQVICAAGRMKTIEAFIHFPTGDIQRNVLRNNPNELVPAEVVRMNALWGDESWRQVAYANHPTLFGPELKKQPIDDLLKAFADRLKLVAGFKYVSQASPMRNSTGVILYHLIFATHYEVAVRIANNILKSESLRKIDGK
jgi:three-Cys-motif partner protein